MEPGFLLDLAHGNSRRVLEWIAGPPEKSVWMGLKLADRPRFSVVTFRCTSCGYLESYAGKD
ncbi:MAG TPA: hypothetical protein PLX89_05895 [Verrucomicrobiota bacterium]|nr:hypothetical protein [Verrucomicrobiales bacterium]HRI12521.1 hypothetical protein [Verrucomicrobiota bacterium]